MVTILLFSGSMVVGITPHMTYQYPSCKICVELYQLFIELEAEDRKKKTGHYIL
jgi:hypothetical protein